MAAKIATKTVDTENQTITWEFTDGEKEVLNLGSLSEEIVLNLALHGASQKGGDSYSGESDLAVAKAKLKGVIERLLAGEWRATREGGTGRITELAQALSEVTGQTIEAVVAMLEEKDKDAKAKLRKHPKVAAKILEIKQRKLAEEGDGDDLEGLLA